MIFKRNQRMREEFATDIPLNIEDDIITFDFIDGIYEINYSKELFDTFPRVKLMHEGCLVKGLTIPFRSLKQIEYRPHKLIW